MQGILPIIKNNSGCDYHRVINPMNYLGMDTRTIPKISTEEMLADTKVLFFNRTPNNPIQKVLDYKRKYGFKIVIDTDDIWELNVRHPMYKVWTEKRMGEEIHDWIKVADAVTVTTARLADKVRPINKNVHVIPNGLPFDSGQFTANKTESDLCRFIYTGGESHVWDVQVLRDVMKKTNVLSNSSFILAGYNPSKAHNWSKMESVFRQTKNYERRAGQKLEVYMSVYENADVCIIPLESNIFTPFKSNIKFLEAGCKYMPVICSNVPPYSDEQDKSKVTYAGNVREWFEALKYHHDNPNFVKEKGQELGEYVRKNYDLRKMNVYRTQLFKHLMS